MNLQNNQFIQLIENIKTYAPHDGANKTPVKEFGVIRASACHDKMRTFYDPVLMFVGQGEKYCYLGDRSFNFSAGHMVAIFLPMPVQTEMIDITAENPFLVAGMRVDLGRLADVLLRIERVDPMPAAPTLTSSSGIISVPISDGMLGAVNRLFDTLADPRDAAVMGELILDEIYYRVLCDERCGDLRTLLQQRGHLQRISRAIDYIHQNLSVSVSVEHLAEMVNMSRTSFYENFKAVTHVSPLQYSKSVKLLEAQKLIVEGKNANEAGYMVGYNSPAQFSREYKRHFGYSPSTTPQMAVV